MGRGGGRWEEAGGERRWRWGGVVVRVGVWVLLFLLVMTIFTWRLNAAYWKDIK
jgi:hypothetical protein